MVLCLQWVPLHQGHLALVKQAAHENDLVVVSIFVNPTQFNNANDLKRYPRDPEKDIATLEGSGCDIVFLPSVDELYPDKVEVEDIDLGGLDKIMEGAHRPDHFDGVATVVSRFFKIVQPNRAYFGEKDYQQLMIIRHITELLDLKVDIVPHPIERSPNGLALSSRNQLLSGPDQKTALALWHQLQWARENYKDFSPQALIKTIKERFEDEPLELEYVEVVDQENLQPLNSWSEARHARIFMAAYLSGVRLIDNLSLF